MQLFEGLQQGITFCRQCCEQHQESQFVGFATFLLQDRRFSRNINVFNDAPNTPPPWSSVSRARKAGLERSVYSGIVVNGNDAIMVSRGDKTGVHIMRCYVYIRAIRARARARKVHECKLRKACVCGCACSLFALELLLPGHRRRQKGAHSKKMAERAYGLPHPRKSLILTENRLTVLCTVDRKQTPPALRAHIYRTARFLRKLRLPLS